MTEVGMNSFKSISQCEILLPDDTEVTVMISSKIQKKIRYYSIFRKNGHSECERLHAPTISIFLNTAPLQASSNAIDFLVYTAEHSQLLYYTGQLLSDSST